MVYLVSSGSSEIFSFRPPETRMAHSLLGGLFVCFYPSAPFPQLHRGESLSMLRCRLWLHLAEPGRLLGKGTWRLVCCNARILTTHMEWIDQIESVQGAVHTLGWVCGINHTDRFLVQPRIDCHSQCQKKETKKGYWQANRAPDSVSDGRATA